MHRESIPNNLHFRFDLYSILIKINYSLYKHKLVKLSEQFCLNIWSINLLVYSNILNTE